MPLTSKITMPSFVLGLLLAAAGREIKARDVFKQSDLILGTSLAVDCADVP